jgi:hypothetical protein
MSTSAGKADPLARSVLVTDEEIRVTRVDGRSISAPSSWFPKLQAASHAARAHWELLGHGVGIHRPEIAEDLGVAGSIAGNRARGSSDRGAA